MSSDQKSDGNPKKKFGLRSQDSNVGSNDPTEVKYKKAIREISKLINLIKALRKDKIQLQFDLSEIEKENQDLRVRLNQVQQQLARPHRMNLTPQHNMHEKQLENTGSISQFIDAKKRVAELQEILVHKQNVIRQMQGEMEDNHLKHRELYHKCERLKEQLQAMSEQQHNQQNQQQHQQNQFQHNQCTQSAALALQLRKTQEEVRLVKQQCQRLKEEKGNHKYYENIQNVGSQPQSPAYNILFGKLSNRPMNQFFSSNMSQNQPMSNNNYPIIQERRKNRSEEQHRKNKKYKHQLKVSKKSNKFYIEKYQNMVTFVDRQQEFIQRYVYKNQVSPYEGRTGLAYHATT